MADQVLQALGQLSKTVGSGLSGIGEAKLRSSQAGLDRAQMEWSLARDAEEREFARPIRELNKKNAEFELKRQNQLVTVDMFAPKMPDGALDVPSLVHMNTPDKKTGRTVFDAFANGIGEGVYYGQDRVYRHKDGSPVLVGELKGRMGHVAAMGFPLYDPVRTAETTLEHKKSLLGTAQAPQKQAALQQEIKQLEHLIKTPGGNRQLIENQLRLLQTGRVRVADAGMRTDDFDNQIKRLEGKLAGIAESQKDAREFQQAKDLEIHKAGLKGDAKIPIAERKYNIEQATNRFMAQAAGAGINFRMDGGAQVTTQQKLAMEQMAAQNGLQVYFRDAGKIDKKGLFTGDEQVFDVVGIMPAEGGRPGEGRAQGESQTLEQLVKTNPALAKQIIAAELAKTGQQQQMSIPPPIETPERGNIGRGPRADPSVGARKELADMAAILHMTPEDLAAFLKFIGQTPEEYRQSLSKNKSEGSF